MSVNGEPGTDIARLKNLVESLLFVADKPVDLRQLVRVLEADEETISEVIEMLGEECRQRGVRILRDGKTVQMVSSPEAAFHVEKFLGLGGVGRLSAAALETLAIIAYEQPVTRAQLQAVRGVNSDRVVANLIARGLVKEAGRLEQAGHPALLATTPEFLQHFGFSSLEELPALEDNSRSDETPAITDEGQANGSQSG
jgi:segregation and condensation protein B